METLIGEIIRNGKRKKEYDIFFLDTSSFSKYSCLLLKTLSEEEKRRASTISRACLKELFVIRKGILRCLLSVYLRCDPWDVGINRKENGKPYVDAENLFFNVSHTKNIFAVVVSKEFEVGVDVQYIKNVSDVSALVSDFCSKAEIAAYTSLGSRDLQQNFFFRVWTAKEAFVKCIGTGLTIDLREVEVLGKRTYRNGREILMDFGSVQVDCVYAVARMAGKEKSI